MKLLFCLLFLILTFLTAEPEFLKRIAQNIADINILRIVNRDIVVPANGAVVGAAAAETVLGFSAGLKNYHVGTAVFEFEKIEVVYRK
jgi:hypothetical protein